MSATASEGSGATASTGETTGAINIPTCGLTGCGVKVKKGGLCSRCRSVNYCSKEHQRSDWPSHKLTCRAVKNNVNAKKIWSMGDQNPCAWTVGLGEKKQREWLVDCYRMRRDFKYALEGDKIVQDFLVFCRLAKEQGALPEGWIWSKFLDTAAELLPYAFEKSDAKEKYGGENVFALVTGGRSLR